MIMPGIRRDVLTAIGATLTAVLSANVSVYSSLDSPHDVHAIVSEEVSGHG